MALLPPNSIYVLLYYQHFLKNFRCSCSYSLEEGFYLRVGINSIGQVSHLSPNRVLILSYTEVEAFETNDPRDWQNNWLGCGEENIAFIWIFLSHSL